MKNKLIWSLFGAFIFTVAGFLSSSSPIVIILTFLPGVFVTSFFQTGEIPFITQGAVAVGLLFWMIASWLLYILLNKVRGENKDIMLVIVITLSFWPIGVALGINFSRFAYWTNNLAYLIWIILPILSAILLILKICLNKNKLK